jgi:hypothetical protein
MPSAVIDFMTAKARQERNVPVDPIFRITKATNPPVLEDHSDYAELDEYQHESVLTEERTTADLVEGAVLNIDEDTAEVQQPIVSSAQTTAQTTVQPIQSIESIYHRGVDPGLDEPVEPADTIVEQRPVADSTLKTTSFEPAQDRTVFMPEEEPSLMSVEDNPNAFTADTSVDDSTSVISGRSGLRPRPSVRQPITRWQEDGRWETSMKERKSIAAKKSYGLHLKLKQAREKYSTAADEAVKKEAQQMLQKKVWELVGSKHLSREQKKSIIRSSLFLKEKFTSKGFFDKLKARLVAGGHMQDRSIYAVDETTSPTASLQSVYLVAGIAAAEGRKVASMDVGGAYLNADLEKEIYMRLQSDFVDVLSQLNPEYSMTREPDGSAIVKLKKALYGLAESSKLWFNLLSSFFVELGFVSNGKDKCVLNKVIDGVQCTIVIYVDDILCTCRNGEAIEWVYSKLVEKFKEVSINNGEKLSYLGQTFDFSKPGVVKVTMEGYVADLLNQCQVKGLATTPALDNLFDITYHEELVGESEKEQFHSCVAKLLYLAKRVRPDLLLSTNFLGTRVTCTTRGDVEKLDRVLRYLNSTQEFGITIDVHSNIHIVAYVDASYAVHKDYKSHTGAVISLGAGPMGVSDALSQIIWTRDFLIEQGYNVGPAILKQDNQSSILMLERGEATSDRSRHIGIRFFFIKDRIANGEVSVEYG